MAAPKKRTAKSRPFFSDRRRRSSGFEYIPVGGSLTPRRLMRIIGRLPFLRANPTAMEQAGPTSSRKSPSKSLGL